MDTKQTRLANFREIWNARFGGNIAAMARALELSANQVRFYLNPEKPGGRWMGEEFARNAEAKLGLPLGSLDSGESASLPDEVTALLATITAAAQDGALTPEQAKAFDALIKTTTGHK